jgi:hypothetical protein
MPDGGRTGTSVARVRFGKGEVRVGAGTADARGRKGRNERRGRSGQGDLDRPGVVFIRGVDIESVVGDSKRVH